ncbi:hypothetical protein Ngar_c27760 [Candidatus Nitrososphaera gargensis Ga9.2]|uniref:Uncharacterized protein n=1 Tax=Nitrososphaera gargensis (strain Ga9.2) TaxID=1237085 RepID=K0ILV2_NITGG|nr:hypothetical protein [Candidatus Nitrososphaera gargensis]AFU59697.1 hypothetical protein Ngar_c27760 [Candidatus Nitrososphaera gargensis Ga9.2]
MSNPITYRYQLTCFHESKYISTRQVPENGEVPWHEGDSWHVLTGFDLEYKYKQALEELQDKTGMSERKIIETIMCERLQELL